MRDWIRPVVFFAIVAVVLGGAWYAWTDMQDRQDQEVMDARDSGYGAGRYDEAKEVIRHIDGLLKEDPWLYPMDTPPWVMDHVENALSGIREEAETDADEYFHYSDDYQQMMWQNEPW